MTDIRLLTSVLLAAVVAACAPPEQSQPEGVAALPAATMDSLLSSATEAGDGSTPVVAPAPGDSGTNRATLAELGYRDGLTFTGAVDAATLTIPVNRGRSAADLTLLLSPTPRMPDGTMVMRQGGRILAQRLVTDTTTQLVLPLGDALVADGRATVTLGMHVPGRDVCEAPLFYRTGVGPWSSVRYTGSDVPVTSVSSFFPPLLDKVTFYLPDNPSLDAAQAALDASAYVARAYRGRSTTFEVAPLPADGASIPEPGWSERALVWTGDGVTRVLSAEGGRGTVLAIASRRDARQLFTLEQGPDMVPTSGFAATTVRLDEGDARLVSLDELGHGNRTITGSVYASSGYRIALADFGGTDVPRAFRLLARHSALPIEGEGEVAFLVNDAIVWSRRVEGNLIDATIAIPERLVARDNVFEIRFTLRLGEGECRLGVPLFTATIDGESSFVVGGRSPLPPSFDRFPTALLPTFSVQLEPRDRYRVELASDAIFAMQQTTATPLAPFLVRDPSEVRGALLAVGTSSTAEALEAPVSSDGFRLRDIDGRVWDEYRPTESYGAMQAFERGGRNILLLHHTGADGQPLADLLREALDPYGWFGVHGDLALRGPAGPTTTLQAANSGWRIESLTPRTQSALARWRSAIFLGAAILLLGLLIWLYPRVVRRELDPAG